MKKISARRLLKRILPLTRQDRRRLYAACDCRNLRALPVVAASLLVCCLCGLCYHLFLSPDTNAVTVYAIGGGLALAAAAYLLVRRSAVTPAWNRLLAPVLCILCYALSVHLCAFVYTTEAACILFLMFLAIPVAFTMPLPINLAMSASFLILFLILDAKAKPAPAFTADLILAVLSFLAGQLLGFGKLSACSAYCTADAQLKAVNYHLYHADAPDPLTGLSGREQSLALLEEVHLAAVSGELYMNCIVWEVDRFPAYNARYGMEAGDLLLKRLGSMYADFEAETGVSVGRIGAATFMAVWADISESRSAFLAGQLSADVTALHIPSELGGCDVTVSMGLYTTQPAVTGEAAGYVYQNADKALFFARNGGGRICRFDAETHVFSPVLPENHAEPV